MMLAALTLLITAGAPITALAAESSPVDDLAAYMNALPTMEETADRLDPTELVNADSYTVEAGTEIDLTADFTNISYDGEKVKVSFYEAKNGDG